MHSRLLLHIIKKLPLSLRAATRHSLSLKIQHANSNEVDSQNYLIKTTSLKNMHSYRDMTQLKGNHKFGNT